ncbi:hypothetical protein DMB95_03735 [Campylobacter sp. MIT 12-8780]|uniref:hypothetical protein n=1 Tax=unclassified Campylobacter TaxID=2593542 RepID=UPI00115D3203|nr:MULTISPECIES: hypothetical protein [unclassified Campylobacter]NDJ27230.1 hypothetical protein [Campylobacter sp. MIT 19-121]TQR41478.1 hypothetical protein DMB95_03735 [Campylobacter sp. MIT 12-8780]
MINTANYSISYTRQTHIHSNAEKLLNNDTPIQEKGAKTDDFSVYDPSKAYTKRLHIDDFKNMSDMEKKHRLFEIMDQAPEVKVAQNSIWQKMWDGTLSKQEQDLLNAVTAEKKIYGTLDKNSFDLEKEQDTLLKTLTSVQEYAKIWGEISDKQKENFFAQAELDFKEHWEKAKQLSKETSISSSLDPISTQDITHADTSSFKPIQAKSSNQTYKDQSLSVLRKLLQDKFDDLNLLKILFENLQEDKKLDIRA